MARSGGAGRSDGGSCIGPATTRGTQNREAMRATRGEISLGPSSETSSHTPSRFECGLPQRHGQHLPEHTAGWPFPIATVRLVRMRNRRSAAGLVAFFALAALGCTHSLEGMIYSGASLARCRNFEARNPGEVCQAPAFEDYEAARVRRAERTER